MIALLAATASAQFRADECTNQGLFPIAGTSGYENGLEALSVQAATYSASSFAERRLFPHAPEEGTAGGTVLYEINQVYNVARVPGWQTADECPADLRIGTRPLDLTAANVGLAARYGRFSAFYSAGVIYGNVAEISNVTRLPMSFVVPVISSAALGLSGVLGDRQVVLGSTAWAIDAMGGAALDLELVELRAAWAASEGAYFSASERTVGLFGNALFRPDAGRVGQAEAGARRIKWWSASETIGRTSVYGRQVPFAQGVAATLRGEARPIDLLTGHFEQADIGGKLDVGAALAAEPELGLYEAHVAFHGEEFHDAITSDELPADGVFLVRAGVVRLPAQWYYGLEGGWLVQARAELSFPFGEAGTGSVVNVAAMFNDAELLALYPFAQNALGWRMSLRGAF